MKRALEASFEEKRGKSKAEKREKDSQFLFDVLSRLVFLFFPFILFFFPIQDPEKIQRNPRGKSFICLFNEMSFK